MAEQLTKVAFNTIQKPKLNCAVQSVANDPDSTLLEIILAIVADASFAEL